MKHIVKLFLLSFLLFNSFLYSTDGIRPNILFILCDDQGPENIGIYGSKAQTPNIDRIGLEGIRFDQALAVSTVCSPSRYNIMTGRYYNNTQDPHYLKLNPLGKPSNVSNDVALEEDGLNFASILQQNGYYTGFIGKFHLTRHDILHTNKGWQKAGLKTYGVNADPKDPKFPLN